MVIILQYINVSNQGLKFVYLNSDNVICTRCLNFLKIPWVLAWKRKPGVLSLATHWTYLGNLIMPASHSPRFGYNCSGIEPRFQHFSKLPRRFYWVATDLCKLLAGKEKTFQAISVDVAQVTFGDFFFKS